MGMRTVHDPYGTPAVLVDRMLGNAYEVVRFVAKNVEFVKHVSAHMEQIYRVDASLEDIDAVSLKLAEIDIIIANMDSLIAATELALGEPFTTAEKTKLDDLPTSASLAADLLDFENRITALETA